ncbi:hypothetical protein EDWATA_00147 [Edwardsiella tarda ATCC 23685]|uniref:Uncharacterized protein n=1 Tax=Edwardsiella tarda ATCC 23685 TaxID=500638 RepID=D4F0C4_EDWTA|nr:hypothetical protein EDWATA_00147 [Edwardsiella tarda ATCC 23685]
MARYTLFRVIVKLLAILSAITSLGRNDVSAPAWLIAIDPRLPLHVGLMALASCSSLLA